MLPLDWIYMTWTLFRSALVVVITLFITRIDRSAGLSPGQISTWVSADRHPLSSHQHYVQPDFRPLSFGRSEFDNRSALRWGECSENAIISVAASCLNDQHLVILLFFHCSLICSISNGGEIVRSKIVKLASSWAPESGYPLHMLDISNTEKWEGG